MSKCLKCGIELICDEPAEIQYKGKPFHYLKSKPHGCPPEYDHSKFSAIDLGYSKEDLDKIFAGVERAQNGGTLTQ